MADTLQQATDKVIEETAQKIMFWWGEGMGAVCAQSKARLESTLGSASFNKVCCRVQELVVERGWN